MQQPNKAYFQLHLAVFFWGFTGVLGTEISMSAPVLVWYRMLGTALFIGIFIALFGKWQRIPKVDFRRLMLVGVLFAIHWVAFYVSVKLAGASVAMVCLATASVFVALLHPLISKGKILISEVIIGLIAVAGVLVMYLMMDHKPSVGRTAGDMRLGIVLGVVAAVLSAVFTVLNKPLAQRYDFRNVVFYEMAAGFVLLTLCIPFYLPHAAAGSLVPQGWDYLWLFCLIYFCTVLGQQLVVQALQKLNPFTVTLSVNLEPVYGIILAFLIHNENEFLGPGFYIGVSVIFISLMLQVWITARRNRRMAPTEVPK